MGGRLERNGKRLVVRGQAKRVSSRVQRGGASPPRRSTSRHQSPAVLSTPDVTRKPLTLVEVLGGTSDNPAPSKFGGTTLERAIDNAAARLGYEFDNAQWVQQLPINGSYTIIDRVRYTPKVAVYIDGPQHDLRTDAEAQDWIQKLGLEDLGWAVLRLNWKDIMRDPISEARKVLFVVMA